MALATYDDVESMRSPVAVFWLMGLCVGVYFLQETLFGAHIIDALGYSPSDLASRSLWTLVTYMFVHGGVMHLLLNMWTLWLFGRRVEQSWGPSTFTWYYLWCGLGGWAFHYMFQGESGVLIGASAAILGVAVAYAWQWPDEEVFLFGVLPMKVVWLVVVMAAINVGMAFLDRGGAGGTAYAAHFGGMVAGWIYLLAPNGVSVDAIRRRVTNTPDYGDETPRAVPRSSHRQRERETDDIVAQSKAAVARARPKDTPRDTPRAAPVAVAEKPNTALDAVLEKIHSEGLSSLTTAEKLLLDEWSQRLRDLNQR
jgi:membrane associated rhomboid family serine protease